jgi:hypothetical protein
VKWSEAAEELGELRTEAEADELVRPTQDQARFPVVPRPSIGCGPAAFGCHP